MAPPTDSVRKSPPSAPHAPFLVAVLVGINVLAIAAALVVPRLIPASGDGLSDGATAALAFFAIMAFALIVSVAALVMALYWRRSLSAPIRWLGWMLFPMNILAVAAMFVYAVFLHGT